MMPLWFVEQEKDIIQFGLGLRTELYRKSSAFQDVRVVDTLAYGKMLVLDGCVMTTDGDEFIYHEMISHPAMAYHPHPKTVVVIGGGDGGTVRELLRYPSIEQIVLCEIDKDVITVSEAYFPHIACGLRDKRVDIRIGDGIAYIKTLKDFADIVIVDSTDPVGPGEGLFTGEFYTHVATALKADGIMVAQSESPWGEAQMLKNIYQHMKVGFPLVRPYIAPIPTYPRGLWSWSMAVKQPDTWTLHRERFNQIAGTLKFLTPQYLEHIFAIPPFYAAKLGLPSSCYGYGLPY